MGSDRIQEIRRFCEENDRYRGLYLTLRMLAQTPGPGLVRSIVSLSGRDILSRIGIGRVPVSGAEADILLQPLFDWKHGALWQPIARAFAGNGYRIAAVSPLREAVSEVSRRCEGVFSEVMVVGNNAAPPERRPSGLPRLASGGLFGRAAGSFCDFTDRMTDFWRTVLARKKVRAFLTTEGFSTWANALVAACRESGIPTFSIQQGLPDGSLWRYQPCDYSIFWTRVGLGTSTTCGFNGKRVLLARNPAIPAQSVMSRMRAGMRARYGAGSDFCILILGQVQFDYIVECEEFYTNLELLAGGLNLLRKKRKVRVFLREHYRDTPREYLNFLQKRLGEVTALKGNTLFEDIALSDAVVSTGSTALEEAYLCGWPIVQVKDEADRVSGDFSVIGTAVAKDPESLASILESENREPGTCSIDGGLPIVDVVGQILGTEGRGNV